MPLLRRSCFMRSITLSSNVACEVWRQVARNVRFRLSSNQLEYRFGFPRALAPQTRCVIRCRFGMCMSSSSSVSTRNSFHASTQACCVAFGNTKGAWSHWLTKRRKASPACINLVPSCTSLWHLPKKSIKNKSIPQVCAPLVFKTRSSGLLTCLVLNRLMRVKFSAGYARPRRL